MQRLTIITVSLLYISCVLTGCNGTTEESHNTKEWAIVVHGGAGSGININESNKTLYEDQLLKAVSVGRKMLSDGEDALDVAEAVVEYMENCPLFNAGKGAVKTLDGIHELDASIMDGSNLKAGAIAGVKDIKNPVKAARMVMDSTAHVFLIGEGASFFAKEMGLDIVSNDYFSTKQREDQLSKIIDGKEEKDFRGTVGCVVKDKKGNLAAATSTGGMSGKKWGRVGDVPVIGAGTYANNNTAAISGTGHGEYWIRRVVAYDISALMEYREISLDEAANEVIFNKIDPMGGSGGGVIAVDKHGNITMVFNTDLMHRAWADSGGEYGVGVLKGEEKFFSKKSL